MKKKVLKTLLYCSYFVALTTNSLLTKAQCGGALPVLCAPVFNFCSAPATITIENKSIETFGVPYYYYLYNGTTRLNPNDSSYYMGFPTSGIQLTLSNPMLYDFSLVVTDGSTCSDTTHLMVSVQNITPLVVDRPTLIKKYYPTILKADYSTDSCIGAVKLNNAAITGGLPPYTYQWYDASKNPIYNATTDSLGNLCKGKYYLKIGDSNPYPCGLGCDSSGSGGIDTNFIELEIGLPLTCHATTMPGNYCTGQNDVSFYVSNGVGPFTTIADTNGIQQTYIGNMIFIPQVSGSGMYNFTVTDNNGESCVATAFYNQPIPYTPIQGGSVSAGNFNYSGQFITFDVIYSGYSGYSGGYFVNGNLSFGLNSYGANTMDNGNNVITFNFFVDSIYAGTCGNLSVYDQYCAGFPLQLGQICIPVNTNKLNNKSALLNNIKLLPNPANNEVIIHTDGVSVSMITITDIVGKVVYTAQSISTNTIINTTQWPNGVYFVKSTTNDSNQSINKLVISH